MIDLFSLTTFKSIISFFCQIAIAKIANAELLTDEKTQPGRPKNLLNYKIPAVCDLKIVGVAHVNFLEYIKRSKQVFD